MCAFTAIYLCMYACIYGYVCVHTLKFEIQGCLRKHLKEIHVETSNLEERCSERAEWRSRVQNGVEDFEKRRVERRKEKRAIRYRDVTTTATQSQFVCQQCDRDCLSRIRLLSHERLHAR